ncbi:DEAD/DEAH box helicase family protein [Castellaniella sp.]|uniref:DEAD/DEAH box helicase family protein n=1 Tax=Castellaniella sp. TaxID=1955812 RepID=UPI002AFFBD36|nr:DEAD/DEAH box helicase [Castellaniella sp.]
MYFSDKLYYIDALAGAGKTEAICQEIAHMVRMGEKVLLVQPTKVLIDQTIKRLYELNVHRSRITTIYKESKSDYVSVVKRLYEHFNNATDDIGQVVITTSAAFDLTKSLYRYDTWHFIGDEFVTGEVAIELKLKKTHSLLTDHIVVEDGHPYALVQSKTRADGGCGLDDLLREAANDSTYRQLYDAASKIASPDWETYVHTSRFNALVSGDGDAKKLHIYAHRKPELFLKFKRCIFVSALFKNSSLYQIFSNRGVQFQPYELTKSELRYETHQNGSSVEIHYLNVDKWSMRKADLYTDLIQKYEEYAIELIGNEKFLYIANKASNHPTLENGYGVRLPGKPHGLNKYMHINHVVVTSAYNPSPTHSEWLRFNGLSDSEMDVMIHCSEVYQGVMRSALRDPLSTDIKKIFVIDVRTALFLHDLFPGSKLVVAPIDIPQELDKSGPEKIYISNAEKAKACRDRKKSMDFIAEHFASLSDNQDECNGPIKKILGNTFHDNHNIDINYSINVYKTIQCKGATSCPVLKDITHIHDLMYGFHNRKVASKFANPLFNFTIFNQTPLSVRRAEHAVATPVMILDNDGGGITYKEFVDIFRDVKMLVFNTFSSTKDNPRWRAIIPLSRYAYADEYKIIFNGIMCKLKERGFVLSAPDPDQPNVMAHGFDLSKSSIVSLYYFPSQAGEEGGSFYEAHIGDDRTLLDPDPLMALYAEYQPQYTATRTEFVKFSLGLEGAVARWREFGSLPGQGDDEFFKLAVAGFRAGLSQDELGHLLTEEAYYAHTPKDRLNRVDYLVNWVFTRLVRLKAA